jgi:hypothetical protein
MALLVALCILVPAAVVWQRPAPPPVALGRAGGTPVSILRRAGAWYWLEQTKKNGDRLMRAASDGVKMISSAEELPRYAVEDGRQCASSTTWKPRLCSADLSVQAGNFNGLSDGPTYLALARKHNGDACEKERWDMGHSVTD